MARSKAENFPSPEKKRKESMSSESISDDDNSSSKGVDNSSTKRSVGVEKTPVKKPEDVIKNVIQEYRSRSRMAVCYGKSQAGMVMDFLRDFLEMINRKKDEMLDRKEIEQRSRKASKALRDGIEAVVDISYILVEIIHVATNTSAEVQKCYLFGDKSFDAYIFLWIRKFTERVVESFGCICCTNLINDKNIYLESK